MAQTLAAYAVVALSVAWLLRPLLRPLIARAGRERGKDGCGCGKDGCGG